MLINANFSDAPASITAPAAPKEMMSVSVRDGKTYVRINSSSVSLIQECLRKSKYSLEEKWKVEDESPATLFGSGIHSALEVYYTGKIEDRKLPSLETLELMSYGNKVEGEETDLILRSVRAFLLKAAPLSQLSENDMRSLQNGVWLLHHYFTTYLNDPYVIYVDETGPFVEKDFTFSLLDTDKLSIDYFGRIDFVWQHSVTKEIIPGDHKTTSMIGRFGDGASYFDREKPNSQYCGYLLGLRTCFGLQLESFIVNIFEVKKKPITRGKDPSFPRQVTTRSEEDFEEFRELVIHSVETYLRAKETGIWPLGPVNACNSYGSCSFRQVCSVPKAMRENVLKAKFKQQGVSV